MTDELSRKRAAARAASMGLDELLVELAAENRWVGLLEGRIEARRRELAAGEAELSAARDRAHELREELTRRLFHAEEPADAVVHDAAARTSTRTA